MNKFVENEDKLINKENRDKHWIVSDIMNSSLHDKIEGMPFRIS